MEDPKMITELATLGATAWASKELAGKLLGPTADYIGGEARTFAEKCNVNITGVFRRAWRMLDAKIDEPGGVSPRVVKDVIDQAAFCDDPMAAEYVAGVLASSRTENGKDDRGVAYLAVIRQLSTFQLRAHYLLYWSIKALLDGKDLSALSFDDPPRMRMFLPLAFLRENELFATSSDEHVLVTHILNGLARHDLAGPGWWGGEQDTVRAGEPRLESESGYFVTPTAFGVELFLWAHGLASLDVSAFLSSRVVFQPLRDVPVHGLLRYRPDLSRERAAKARDREVFKRMRIEARRRGL
jgi:hypothetical protein